MLVMDNNFRSIPFHKATRTVQADQIHKFTRFINFIYQRSFVCGVGEFDELGCCIPTFIVFDGTACGVKQSCYAS